MTSQELTGVEATEVATSRRSLLRVEKAAAALGQLKGVVLSNCATVRRVVSQIVGGNVVAFRTLWDAQPRATTARLLVGMSGVLAPVLGWWGSGQMIDALTNSHSRLDLALGATAFITSFCILGVIPVALSSLERMSDNCTFELVFAKFTRKMITFNQEQLSDPVLAEQIKQVRERAVWRMMAIARSQPQAVRNIGALLVAGGLLAVKAPLLLLALVGFSLPTMVLELRHAHRRCELDEHLAPIWGGLWDDLRNLMVTPSLAMLHQFGATLWFAGRYREGLASASARECKLETDAAVMRALAALVAGGGIVASVLLLASNTLAGSLSVGGFVLLLGAVSNFGACLAETASLLGQQWSQSKSLRDLLDFLSHSFSAEVSHRRLPFNQEYASAGSAGSRQDQDSRGSGSELVFENVSYRYPSANPERLAVCGVSFEIKRGSVVAVVGPNGAGKSSAMALMLRQLDPTAGRILIDGKPIDQMTSEEFAGKVVMLPQQLRHYNLNLRELLNLGRPHAPASDEALWQELERIGAAEFVRKWDDGLDTPLGLDRRKAVEPSGGQLQRLLLASVLIASRGLIVMDEPVAAVDPEAAKRFWDALFAERTGRTVIFSTHHLGAVRRADKILFIEDGRVAAQGKHDELMLSSERYRNLFEAQANEYK